MANRLFELCLIANESQLPSLQSLVRCESEYSFDKIRISAFGHSDFGFLSSFNIRHPSFYSDP
jgi:hypothetical protein